MCVMLRRRKFAGQSTRRCVSQCTASPPTRPPPSTARSVRRFPRRSVSWWTRTNAPRCRTRSARRSKTRSASPSPRKPAATSPPRSARRSPSLSPAINPSRSVKEENYVSLSQTCFHQECQQCETYEDDISDIVYDKKCQRLEKPKCYTAHKEVKDE